MTPTSFIGDGFKNWLEIDYELMMNDSLECHTVPIAKLKCQKCTSMGLNGFISKKLYKTSIIKLPAKHGQFSWFLPKSAGLDVLCI